MILLEEDWIPDVVDIFGVPRGVFIGGNAILKRSWVYYSSLQSDSRLSLY